MILAQASGTGGGVIGLDVSFLVGDGDIGEGRGAPTSRGGVGAGCQYVT